MNRETVLGSARQANILLVEDNEADVILTQEALKASKLPVRMQHVDNGEKCMAYLRKQEPYKDAIQPDLILLDLNLPIMDGREVLAEMLNDEKLRRLPVVVLTTSNAQSDLIQMYGLRCNSYIVKPVDFGQFRRAIMSICDYWFTVVSLPP